jgi:hypothetical protein
MATHVRVLISCFAVGVAAFLATMVTGVAAHAAPQSGAQVSASVSVADASGGGTDQGGQPTSAPTNGWGQTPAPTPTSTCHTSSPKPPARHPVPAPSPSTPAPTTPAALLTATPTPTVPSIGTPVGGAGTGGGGSVTGGGSNVGVAAGGGVVAALTAGIGMLAYRRWRKARLSA